MDSGNKEFTKNIKEIGFNIGAMNMLMKYYCLFCMSSACCFFSHRQNQVRFNYFLFLKNLSSFCQEIILDSDWFVHQTEKIQSLMVFLE